MHALSQKPLQVSGCTHLMISMCGRPHPPSGVAWYGAVRAITQQKQPGDSRSDRPAIEMYFTLQGSAYSLIGLQCRATYSSTPLHNIFATSGHEAACASSSSSDDFWFHRYIGANICSDLEKLYVPSRIADSSPDKVPKRCAHFFLDRVKKVTSVSSTTIM